MLEELLIQALGFVVLFLILRQFAWKPLLLLLDERRQRIEESFQSIEQAKRELESLQADYTRRLGTIDEEAREKIRQAIQEGRRMASEIQDEARAQSQGIIAKSQETIELELAKAKVSLRDELADMTIEAVQRLLRQKLDAKTDQQLVASILEELGHAAPPRE